MGCPHCGFRNSDYHSHSNQFAADSFSYIISISMKEFCCLCSTACYWKWVPECDKPQPGVPICCKSHAFIRVLILSNICHDCVVVRCGHDWCHYPYECGTIHKTICKDSKFIHLSSKFGNCSSHKQWRSHYLIFSAWLGVWLKRFRICYAESVIKTECHDVEYCKESAFTWPGFDLVIAKMWLCALACWCTVWSRTKLF